MRKAGNFRERCNCARGQEDRVDLRVPLRALDGEALLDAAIVRSIAHKPRGHDFAVDRAGLPSVQGRRMSATGG